jgi:ABC-type branched-subunit amino acid transport system substrate-binding protein
MAETIHVFQTEQHRFYAEMRLNHAVSDVQEAAADFAVLTADASTVSELVKIAKDANRLAQLLSLQADAALIKADTL